MLRLAAMKLFQSPSRPRLSKKLLENFSPHLSHERPQITKISSIFYLLFLFYLFNIFGVSYEGNPFWPLLLIWKRFWNNQRTDWIFSSRTFSWGCPCWAVSAWGISKTVLFPIAVIFCVLSILKRWWIYFFGLTCMKTGFINVTGFLHSCKFIRDLKLYTINISSSSEVWSSTVKYLCNMNLVNLHELDTLGQDV